MSDLRENPELARGEILLQAEELKLSIRRAEFRILQLKDEIRRNVDNIAATKVAIKETEARAAAIALPTDTEKSK